MIYQKMKTAVPAQQAKYMTWEILKSVLTDFKNYFAIKIYFHPRYLQNNSGVTV